MKRREQPSSGPAVPESLCRFVRSEWPGTDRPFRAWCEARLAYVHEHGYDTPLGGPIEVLGEHRRLKLAGMADGEPGPFGPYQ